MASQQGLIDVLQHASTRTGFRATNAVEHAAAASTSHFDTFILIVEAVER